MYESKPLKTSDSRVAGPGVAPAPVPGAGPAVGPPAAAGPVLQACEAINSSTASLARLIWAGCYGPTWRSGVAQAVARLSQVQLLLEESSGLAVGLHEMLGARDPALDGEHFDAVVESARTLADTVAAEAAFLAGFLDTVQGRRPADELARDTVRRAEELRRATVQLLKRAQADLFGGPEAPPP
jgi:hypothetical protein